MNLSTQIRNSRMMALLVKGKTPKEVARRFNLTVWSVYKAQKAIQESPSFSKLFQSNSVRR